jgi:PPM family protein phosphatase
LLDFSETCIGREDRTSFINAGDSYIFLVADGAGGIGGGAEAADYFISTASSELLNEANNLSPQFLRHFLISLDEKILGLPDTGETTAIIVVVNEGRLFGASVGDSESWVFGDDYHEELTDDQVRKPLLGSGCSKPVSFSSSILNKKLILGTDGLFKYANAGDIKSVVCAYSPQECIPRLLDLVRYPSGSYPDDIGIIVCEVK